MTNPQYEERRRPTDEELDAEATPEYLAGHAVTASEAWDRDSGLPGLLDQEIDDEGEAQA